MVIVGSCPKCGAPIYAPSVWQGITPPTTTHTCMCSYVTNTYYNTTNTVGTTNTDSIKIK